MSIPKVLHYCWFGGAPKPKNIQNCIRSWKKYCPDYEIIEWNEQNFDVSQSLYTRQAYDARRWAFVADYARLKILYEQGGIYMDTDVELLRPLDDLLAYPAFFGFQHNNEVATGLSFGAEAHSPVVKALLDDYDSLPFLLPDGSCDLTPARNEIFPSLPGSASGPTAPASPPRRWKSFRWSISARWPMPVPPATSPPIPTPSTITIPAGRRRAGPCSSTKR